ncbi:hypothetical protein AMTR_s00095p00151510 [Amborella trichopoda]|uniref:F-box domain-containing protein n=2 Tax=Amborella trichopoda TaxID=13333 RepID=W1NRP5_AMBTC|nr:hypothetical protein AMTR_s00095p00151510 [Amborella trichopoda]
MGSLCCALPDELMLKILTQLPVQSILNFKAISKSWNETLSSPSFATAHSLSSSPFSPTFPLFVQKSGIFSIPPPPRCLSLSPNDTQPQLLKHLPDDASVDGLTTCNGLICFYDRTSQSYYIGNPATSKYTVVPAPVDCFYNGVVGLGYDPISFSFKILIQCSPKSDTPWRWCLFSSLTRCWETVEAPTTPKTVEAPTPKFDHRCDRAMACTGSTCYGVFCSCPNFVAFDLNTKSWDSFPPPEGLSYSCRRLGGLFIHTCKYLLKTQMWGDRVCIFNINHDLELKIWVLNREMRNWELVVNAGLQNLKDKPGNTLEALLLVGDTLFISRHNDRLFISRRHRDRHSTKITIAYNVRSHQFTIIEDLSLRNVFDFVPYKTTLLSWDA